MVRSAVSPATIGPEEFAARVRANLRKQAADRLIERLWNKDASLWTSHPDEQRHILNRLGWLSIASVMEAHVREIEAAAADIRQAGFTHAILLGMGGSSLFSEVCRFTFGVASGWLDLAVLDSTDPSAIAAAQRRAPIERTLIIVSSKSGATTETSALCGYFYEQALATSGSQAGRQFVAITDAGTPLQRLAEQRRFRYLFVHGPSTGQDVGGRFSALTYFGLVPVALLGVQVGQLLTRAQQMLMSCRPTAPVLSNPAAELAGCLSEAAAIGRDKMTLLTAPELASFGGWMEQLVAESTGKSGKGLVPVDREPLWEPEAYEPDRIFIELQLKSEPDLRLERAVDALAAAGHPVVRLRWQDRYDLGGEVVRWSAATALTASLMRINAFDEPNVQESKDRTKALLDHYSRSYALPQEPPLVTDKQIAVYGDLPQVAGRSVADALRGLLAQAKPNDYLALSSFLPRLPSLDAAVQTLRNRLAKRVRIATTIGYGPRYLHSTGQLHKGGPETGLFLFLTADDPADLPVPGEPYTFSVLKQAQGLGDFQALKERHRRVLRLHLGASPLDALRALESALRLS